MIPPGLTCARCERALYPEVARLDGEVYVHAGRCNMCAADGCDREYHAKGYCHRHYTRLREFGDANANVSRAVVIELEDVEFLAETGESLIGAAARLGAKTPEALDAWLRRKGRADLARQLIARNPRDWNKAADGTALVRETGGDNYRERLARRNESKRRQRAEASAA